MSIKHLKGEEKELQNISIKLMETLKLTAYHKWLIERSGGDIDVLALRIYFDARDQNQMA
jgi:hypothetical protein